jgi:adenosylcobinamide kinase / adenosylcobinamide-phosphate guanylyltransferase
VRGAIAHLGQSFEVTIAPNVKLSCTSRMSKFLPETSCIILVTGPARSGKSEWAEHLAQLSGRQVTYVATATLASNDAEWTVRIQQHQQRRPLAWKTLELSAELPQAIAQCKPTDCLLVDSLGTWLVPYLEVENGVWQEVVNDLLTALRTTAGEIIFVSEETGWGVIPAYPIGRLFRDRLGALTRQVGAVCEHVYLVTAGYALDVRQMGEAVPYSPEDSGP